MKKLQKVLLFMRILSKDALNSYRINFWNPLTYPFILIYIPCQLIFDGIEFIIKSIKKLK